MSITNVNQIGISQVQYTSDGKSIILPSDGFIYWGDDVSDGSVRAGLVAGVFTVQTKVSGTWTTDFSAV